MAGTTRQLADVLLEERLISPEDLARAPAHQRQVGKSLGRVLIETGLFTEAGLVAALAKHLGLAFVELADRQLDTTAIALVPEQMSRRYSVIPIAFDDDGRLVVAMADPSNVL